MLTIPIQPGSPTVSPARPAAAVLIVGRSEKVLADTVDLLEAQGHAAGATNDFEHLLELFDARDLTIVVFGGMVPPDRKEALRAELAAANPELVFLQGLAGIPGLLVAQVQAAICPSSRHAGAISYSADDRSVTIDLDTQESVSVTAFWGTAFIPPDPASTSEVLFEGTLAAGAHSVPLPPTIPDAASFLAVSAGPEVYTFVVGALPPGTTLAATAAVPRLGGGA
jgi:hypothetical protein